MAGSKTSSVNIMLKRLGVLLLLVNRMLVHFTLTPSISLGFPDSSPVAIYAPWVKRTKQNDRDKSSNPDLSTSTLATRPPRLPQTSNIHLIQAMAADECSFYLFAKEASLETQGTLVGAQGKTNLPDERLHKV